MTISGIGPLISTAIIAAIDKGEVCNRGREFATWFGPAPHPFSTDGPTNLGRISKRGNGYLWMLLVQAVNVILMRPHHRGALRLGPWLRGVVAGLPQNEAAVVLPTNWPHSLKRSALRH